ncbi:MAG TPA: hypothetical protein DCM08_07895 [Microscillaceae bacterium]|nr:hypothetical protein [Microscillaceae bacterium]
MTVKKNIVILSLFLCCLGCTICFNFTSLYAQQAGRIERLERMLKDSKNDTSTIRILHSLYKEYSVIEPLRAKKYAEQSLAIAEKNNFQEAIASSQEDIANIYQGQGLLSTAAELYLKVLDIKKSLPDKKGVATTLNNLGNVSVRQGESQKALEYYKEALKLRKELNDTYGVSVVLTNIGVLYYNQANYDQALFYHLEALSKADSTGKKKIITYNLNRIGECFFRKNQYDEALKYYQQQLVVANNENDKFEVQKAYLGLSQVYAELKNYRKAYEYYQLYSSAKEDYFKEKSSAQIEDIRAAQKQTETELLLLSKDRQIQQDRIERTNLILLFSLIALGLILVTVVILYRSNRVSKKINQILEKQKQEIEQASKELQEQKEKIEAQHEAIQKKNQTLEVAVSEIERKNKDITSSINYAKRIQESMLPFERDITVAFPEHFIIFKPRDIVSGDFYWFAQIGRRAVLAAVDCTGHGVPGAIMSMVGNDHLNSIIKFQQITDPQEALDLLHDNIIRTLQQETTDNRDGMDIALCMVDLDKRVLEFAGAGRPLLVVQNGEIHDFMSCKLPIGGLQKDARRFFEKYTFELPQDESSYFYIFSDGFQDQFGGPKGRKFGKDKLKELIFEHHKKPIQEQRRVLDKTLTDWMGDNRQMDDILLIGLKI